MEVMPVTLNQTGVINLAGITVTMAMTGSEQQIVMQLERGVWVGSATLSQDHLNLKPCWMARKYRENLRTTCRPDFS